EGERELRALARGRGGHRDPELPQRRAPALLAAERPPIGDRPTDRPTRARPRELLERAARGAAARGEIGEAGEGPSPFPLGDERLRLHARHALDVAEPEAHGGALHGAL